jgi:hypothetical protein
LSFSKGAGTDTGTGNFLFSTYHTGWQNSSQLPTGVTNMNDASATDNSAFVSDRFWQINAQGYGTKPILTNVAFTYLDAENSATGNSITESGLIAKRYNSALTSWTDHILTSTVNTVNNTVTVTPVDAANLQPWWVLGTLGGNRYWVAPSNSNSNLTGNWSATAGGAGNAGVPTLNDAVIFDGTSDFNCTLDADITAANFQVDPGFTGTITQGTNIITIGSAANFSGGTFLGGTGNITASGPFTLSGTAFTSTSGILDLKNNFAFTSGSFAHNNGTVKFSGTSTIQNITGSSVANFNNISVTNTAANPGVSVESNQNLTGVLTLAGNVILDADGSANNSVFRLISTADNPTHDASIALLPPGAQVIGNVTVQRFMSLEGAGGHRIYRYISSPVQSASVADIQGEIPVTGTFTGTSACSGCSTQQSMFAYDETVITDTNGDHVNDPNDGYIDFPSASNSEMLIPGKGYALFVRGNLLSTALWDVRGPINTGNITLPVAFTSSGTAANDGWNLVGNPFPSTIDWNAASGWTKANLEGTVYITDNGFVALQYATWNGTDGTNGGTTNIAMGQGFFVKGNGLGVPGLQANDSVKVAGTQTVLFRTAAPENVLRVTMVGGTTRDEAVIHFRDDATELFDAQADAWKLMNGTFNISSRLSNGNKLAINSLPALNCNEKIHLAVDNATAGAYALKFSLFESFSNDVAILLSDKFTNTTTDIRALATYDFSVTADTSSFGANRFSINVAVPSAKSDFVLSGADVCTGTGASIQITNSQAGATYSTFSNNNSVSAPTAGNGGVIIIPIPVDSLQLGQNVFAVKAVVAACNLVAERDVALIVIANYDVASIQSGQHCREGQVSLNATGAPDGGTYNWYESVSSALPDQHSSLFVTPSLLKSKTYYVAIPNALGCEGERKAIVAEIVLYDDAAITETGHTLTSNYIDGNQWSFNNAIIAGATGQSIEADKSGVYSVNISIQSCTTSASRELIITGLKKDEFVITVFPNPVIDDAEIEIPEEFSNPAVKVMNSLGQPMGSIGLHHDKGKVIGKLEMKNYPPGVYILHVAGSGGVVEIKVMKE